jgi:hypothetical protein
VRLTRDDERAARGHRSDADDDGRIRSRRPGQLLEYARRAYPDGRVRRERDPEKRDSAATRVTPRDGDCSPHGLDIAPRRESVKVRFR